MTYQSSEHVIYKLQSSPPDKEFGKGDKTAENKQLTVHAVRQWPSNNSSWLQKQLQRRSHRGICRDVHADERALQEFIPAIQSGPKFVFFVFLLSSAAWTLLLQEAHARFVKNSGAHSQLVMAVLCRSRSVFEWSLSHCRTAERHNVQVVSKKHLFHVELHCSLGDWKYY